MSEVIKVSTAEKIRKLKWFVVGGAANSVFVELTVFGSLFVLFLDALGIPVRQIGFLLSLFPFTGVLAILITPYVEMVGYKRVYVWFFGARKVAIMGLLVLPWVMGRLGGSVFEYVVVVVGLFALFRAIAETAYFPWNKEFVPDRVRGRLEAWTHIAATVTGLVAVGLSSWLLARSSGVNDYVMLMAVGVVFGGVAVWAFAQLPGGGRGEVERRAWVLPNIREPFGNAQFRRLLLGVGLVSVATGPVVAFMPLYLSGELGLSTSVVLQSQFVAKLGGLVFGYVWGWAADRYGSKPVMLSGLLAILVFLGLLLGLSWAPGAVYWLAMGVAFWQGSVFIGWHLGFSRLLFLGVVPEENKKDFLAVYYAYMGLIGGASQLLAGWWLDSGVGWVMFGQVWSAYLLLTVLSIGLLVVSIWVLRGIREERALSVREFLSFWVMGNPLSAIESVMRYSWAGDEQSAVKLTERMGSVKSHLTVNELLDALDDPRFSVRYEAVIAIGRARANSKLTKGLKHILDSGDPALSVAATWALGRMGSYRCIEILKTVLNSESRSVREQAVRALTYLGVEDVAEELFERLKKERDMSLRVAYCGYLGRVRWVKSLPVLLEVLGKVKGIWRREMCLAVARMVGVEKGFVKNLKSVDEDAGTGLALLLGEVERRQRKLGKSGELTELSEFFSEEDWMGAKERGVAGLCVETEGGSEQLIVKEVEKMLVGGEEDVVLWVLVLGVV